jgi:GT2 family glycosyltransferase
MLNPDAQPDPTGVAAARAALDASPHVGAVQGTIINRATGAPERSQGRELGPVHLVARAVGARRLLAFRPVRAVARHVGLVADHVERVPTTPQRVESLAATALLVRRESFDSVGGFDESYFLYGEDLDLCRRLRGAGWELLAIPEPVARHDNGASSSTTTERELSWWRGTMRFAALWWSSAAWTIALLAAALAWVRLSARRPRSSRRAWCALVADPVRDRRARRS